MRVCVRACVCVCGRVVSLPGEMPSSLSPCVECVRQSGPACGWRGAGETSEATERNDKQIRIEAAMPKFLSHTRNAVCDALEIKTFSLQVNCVGARLDHVHI